MGQENQPDVWRKTRRILVAKDFIKFKLTGQTVTDYSEASGTLLFDVEREGGLMKCSTFSVFPHLCFPA